MSIERLVSQRREVKAIQQGSGTHPRDDSLSIHRMASVVQTARRIAVDSRRSARRRWSREPGPAECPRPASRSRGSPGQTSWGLRGIPPTGASVFHLRPPTRPVEPHRAQDWAHARAWRTHTAIESYNWKAAGLGLAILCFSRQRGMLIRCFSRAMRIVNPVLPPERRL